MIGDIQCEVTATLDAIIASEDDPHQLADHGLGSVPIAKDVEARAGMCSASSPKLQLLADQLARRPSPDRRQIGRLSPFARWAAVGCPKASAIPLHADCQ